jgi:hypothetical protein
VGLTTLHCKKENFEKPPRNLAGFCGGGQGLSWAVEPRKEEEEEEEEEKKKIHEWVSKDSNFHNLSQCISADEWPFLGYFC